jgi:hypothetical protein
MSFDDSANRRCVLTCCRNRGRPGNSLLTRAREGALARAPSARHNFGSWQVPLCEGLPGAKHPTPEFEWQQLPEETRQMVTGLMVHLLVNHQRRDHEPSSTGRRGDV